MADSQQRSEKVVTWEVDETSQPPVYNNPTRSLPTSPKQSSLVSSSDVIVERDMALEEERKLAKKGEYKQAAF